MRVKRGTLLSTHEGGRLYVLLERDPTTDPERVHDRTSELTATLRDRLEAERQAHAEVRRTIAGLVERIPAIEAPQAPTELPQDAEDVPEGAENPGPPPQALRRAHGVRGGGGC